MRNLDRYGTVVILLAGLLAASVGAVEAPPPHPGEPADQRVLNPNAESTPARIYAREHPEGPPRVEPVHVQPAQADNWELKLPKLHPAGADAVLTLAIRNGAVVNGYTLAPGADNFFHYTSTYRLELAGGKLTGSVRIRFLSKSELNAAECLQLGQERVVILDVSAAAGKLTGSGVVIGDGSDRKKIEVSGVVYAGGRPSRPEDALAGGALWPGHRGPLASGAALDKGYTLVEDMGKARPVWKCAEDLPDGRAHHSGGGPLGTIDGGVDWLRHSGTKCGPVVADGRVLLYTLVPSGEVPVGDASVKLFDRVVVEQGAHDWMPGRAGAAAAALPDLDASEGKATTPSKQRVYPQCSMFCIGADDVVFCFDARTGATLWKTVYPGASANFGGSKGGPHLQPFVWQGKIYVLGATDRIYCLDAKTGTEVWQNHTGWSATCKYKIQQDCLVGKGGFPHNRSMEFSLVVADLSSTNAVGNAGGVVVCSDSRGKLHQKDGYGYTKGSGLIGLDALTGKRLWQTEEGVIASSTPVRWTHKGKTYILAASDAVRCFDPKDGKMLWKVPCEQTGMCLVADEDRMLAHVGGAVTCFQVTPEKAEKMWSLPSQYQMPWGGYFYPVIYRGHTYFASGAGIVCVKLADGEVVAETPGLGGGHTGGGDFLIAGEERTFSSGICVTGVEENTKALQAPWRVAFAIGYLTPLDPALADGCLFFRDKTGLVCYDLRARAKP